MKLNFITWYAALYGIDTQRVNTGFLNDLNLPLSVKEIYLGSLVLRVVFISCIYASFRGIH